MTISAVTHVRLVKLRVYLIKNKEESLFFKRYERCVYKLKFQKNCLKEKD